MTAQATIYLCDDEEEVVEGLSFLFRQSGYKVRPFLSGKGLLDAISVERQPLRAVFVLDLHNPPMDGDVIHDQLIERGYTKRSPVIFLSGHGSVGRAVKAVEKGALSYIEKPHTDSELLSLLSRAMKLEEKLNAISKRCEFLKFMWEGLTLQQRKVAVMVASGELNKNIASHLSVVERTVEVHRSKVFEKLGVDSAATLATTIADMKNCGIGVSDETS